MSYCGRVVSCAIGLTLILNSSELTAQTTGRIEGRVVDQAGDVLPGANVRVEGPSLQGARSVVSDHQGRFRFPVVPPGTHTVRVELTGFAARVLADVRVGLDRTATLEIEMQPALTEAMTVEGESPIIDLAGTTTGADYDDKLMRSLPLGRDFMGLAFTAPGVTPSGLGDNPSVRGASAAENRYVIDGIDVTDPGYGTWKTSIAPELLEQVEVKTGGYQAEYGGALGGVLNVVTKSGSNLFHGDVFGYFNNDSLSAGSPATEGLGRTLGRSTYDLGFDVGGKLVHDRLWYFAALNPWFSDTDALTRQDLAYTTKAKTLSYSGKLTWRPDDKNQLVLSAFGDPSRTDDSELRSAAGHVVSDSESGASTYSARLSSTPNPRLLLELNAGYYHQTDQTLAERGDLASYYDLSAGGGWARAQGCGDPSLVSERGVSFVPGCRGSTNVWDGDRSRGQVRGSASWFVSSHALKLGLDWSRTSFGVLAHSTGPHIGSLADGEGTVFAPDGIPGGSFTLYDGYYELDTFEQDAVGKADELALYVQDQWRITPRFTLNAGVRFDSLSSTGSTTAEFPNRRLEFGLGDMMAPRVGIVWDVTGKGQSRVFASAARFFESVPLDLAVRSFGREHSDVYYFLYPEDAALPTYDNPGLFLDSFGFGTGVDTDPGLKAQYTDELVVGIEHELVRRGLAVGLKGVYRELGNVVEDISLDDGETYFITNPARAPSTATRSRTSCSTSRWPFRRQSEGTRPWGS